MLLDGSPERARVPTEHASAAIAIHRPSSTIAFHHHPLHHHSPYPPSPPWECQPDTQICDRALLIDVLWSLTSAATALLHVAGQILEVFHSAQDIRHCVQPWTLLALRHSESERKESKGEER